MRKWNRQDCQTMPWKNGEGSTTELAIFPPGATLEDFVWSNSAPTTSNALAVYIGYLRRKLKGSRASMLETLRGSGYRLARRAEK